MKSKSVSLVSFVVVLIAAYWMHSGSYPQDDMVPESMPTSLEAKAPTSPQEHIQYTKHARCRMKCRHISEEEVRVVLAHGKINHRKSDNHASPCPVTAKEFTTQDQQNVRVVYGECENTRKIITVIDLRNDFACDCD